MLRGITKVLSAGLLLVLAAGCHSDKPHEYGKERPPVDQLDARDKGLQSKDVISASDQMAQDLLTQVPELHSSREKWTIVFSPVENYTSDRTKNLNIFIDRLRVRLRQLDGSKQIAIIENRDRLHDLQSHELEAPPSGDQFGQGGASGTPGAGPAGQQPDFSLYAKVSEMPNRGTSYYFIEFTLTAIQDTPQHRAREIVWTNAYEVKVNN